MCDSLDRIVVIESEMSVAEALLRQSAVVISALASALAAVGTDSAVVESAEEFGEQLRAEVTLMADARPGPETVIRRGRR